LKSGSKTTSGRSPPTLPLGLPYYRHSNLALPFGSGIARRKFHFQK
jgi:hypothetical protein